VAPLLVSAALALTALVLFRRGHDALFRDWRKGVALFVVSYVLLHFSSLLRQP